METDEAIRAIQQKHSLQIAKLFKECVTSYKQLVGGVDISEFAGDSDEATRITSAVIMMFLIYQPQFSTIIHALQEETDQYKSARGEIQALPEFEI